MDSYILDQGLSSTSFQSGAPGLQSVMPPKSQEPNIDLELDVKVFINSGKCVLHTKDLVREEEIKL